MRLSKRETYFAVGAIAAVALLALDRYLITPLMDSGAALRAEQALLVKEMEDAERLFDRRRLMGRKWEELTAGGLTSDPQEAESRLLHAMRDWAEEWGLSLSSLKPERDTKGGTVREITVVVSGTGPMRAVTRFLWRAETTGLPLRIREVQVSARKEGTDELSLQLKASTLYLGADEPATPEANEEGEGET